MRHLVGDLTVNETYVSSSLTLGAKQWVACKQVMINDVINCNWCGQQGQDKQCVKGGRPNLADCVKGKVRFLCLSSKQNRSVI